MSIEAWASLQIICILSLQAAEATATYVFWAFFNLLPTFVRPGDIPAGNALRVPKSRAISYIFRRFSYTTFLRH